MSSSSSRANAGGRITETTPMTDMRTEISTSTKTEKWLITLAVLLPAVLVIVLLFYCHQKAFALYQRYLTKKIHQRLATLGVERAFFFKKKQKKKQKKTKKNKKNPPTVKEQDIRLVHDEVF
jgi:hypothetical protein